LEYGICPGYSAQEILLTSPTLLFLLLALFQFGNLPQRFTLFLMNRYAPPKLPILPDSNAPITSHHRLQPDLSVDRSCHFRCATHDLGIADGEKGSSLSLRSRIGLLMGAVLATLTILPQAPGFGLLLRASGREWILQHQHVTHLLSLITYWPLLYIIGVR
jgi:hypothetical protein